MSKKVQRWDDEWGKYMTNVQGHVVYPVTTTYEDRQWFEHCLQFEKYLRNNNKAPQSSTDLKLYQWFNRQKQLLRKGDIRIERRDAIITLINEVEQVEENGKRKDAELNIDRINRRKRQLEKKLQKQQEILESTIENDEGHSNDNISLAKKEEKHQCQDEGRNGIQNAYKEIKLYDYQADMKNRIENAFKSYQSVMVQMPTGTGKTHVVASVVRDFVLKDVVYPYKDWQIKANNSQYWIINKDFEL